VGSKRNNRLKPVESSFIPWLKTQGFSLSHYVLIGKFPNLSIKLFFKIESLDSKSTSKKIQELT
jgi:hypothetical protein